MMNANEFFADFSPSDDIQEAGKYLINAGAKVMFDDYLTDSSDEFIVQVLLSGSNGSYWEVCYDDGQFSVTTIPNMNIWSLNINDQVNGSPTPFVLGLRL